MGGERGSEPLALGPSYIFSIAEPSGTAAPQKWEQWSRAARFISASDSSCETNVEELKDFAHN